MSGPYGAGIQRGQMAADKFTQISNALFRDPRMSYKAKGIFGLISTHTDGWRVTIADLVRASTDGKSAVTAGVKELEQFGYLTRDRERNPDGTLGGAVYSITDMPAHLFELFGENAPELPKKPQTRRSEPKSENPALDNPAQANRTTKNTKPKKTNQQKTNTPVRPSVEDAGARDAIGSGTDGRMDGGGGVIEDQEQPQLGGGEAAAADAAPLNDNSAAAGAVSGGGGPAECPPVPETPGVLLLAEIGAWHPEYLVTGQTLADQGLVVTGMLAAGWKPASIRQVITGRPLPVPMTHTVGAIISARLRQAAAGPAPSPTASWGAVPAQGGPADSPVDHSSTAVAGRTVAEALEHRARYECAECGRPPAPGMDLCGACAGWPACTTGCGRHLEHGGICPDCAEAAEHAGIPAQAAEDGSCPGHNGPCGRPVATLGLCGRCRVAAEVAKRKADDEWETARAAAIAAAQEAEAGGLAQGAPF